MSIQSVAQFECGRWHGKRVEMEPVQESLTSDAGLLPFAQLDRKLGWTEQLASLISDPRGTWTHSALSIVRQRVFGIIAGYEDQNDHDTLRSDPIFKLIADREPDQCDLASQPTISRLENAVTAQDLLKMEDWFIDRFVESFDETTQQITLDIDTSDDPTHGQQQLALFHGFYQQEQYLIRLITCDENDRVVLPVLLFGSAVAKLGAIDDLRRVIERLRSRFPEVAIHVRADSAFGGPQEYQTLESLGVTYSIGLKINSKIKRLTDDLLAETTILAAQLGQPQVRYIALENYESKQWDRPRTVVVKVEVTAHSNSRRCVITNQTQASSNPEAVYCEYAQRGESENRNKELKCDLQMDRLSDHRYMANLFRLMLHCLSHNLVTAMRAVVRMEGDEGDEEENEDANATDRMPNASQRESEKKKRQRHNDRRRRDVLGEAHPATWRMLVIKVAARVIVTARRVRILLSGHWPNLRHLQRTAAAVCLDIQ